MKKLNMLVKHLFFPGWDFGTRARRKLVRYFLSGNISTLDAGCGNGAFSLAAYRLGNRVVGINMDRDQVRRCQEYGQYVGAAGGRLHFRVFNIYDLRNLNKTFDQDICFETLEHLMRDKEVVQIFSDCLAPGGRLHLCTPNLDCVFNGLKGISKTEDGGHVWVGYTHGELEGLMRGREFSRSHAIPSAATAASRPRQYSGGSMTDFWIECPNLSEMLAVWLYLYSYTLWLCLIILCLILPGRSMSAVRNEL